MLARFIVVLSLLFGGSAVFALDDGERESLRGLQDWYPIQGCKKDRELGQCFKWTERDCELKTGKAVEVCLRKNEKQFRRSATGNMEFWQDKILLCTFDELKQKNAKLYLDSALCQMPAGAR